MSYKLRLFPLNVVLFPYTKLSLHIFEERYKIMIKHCLEDDSKFGVVLIKSGREVGGDAEPFSVGTVARIASLKKLDEGRMSLTVVGEKRFQITSLLHSMPYLEAFVGKYDDTHSEFEQDDIMEAREALSNYIQILQRLIGGWTSDNDIPKDPVSLSYYIGDILRVNSVDKQGLLEECSIRTRILKATKIVRNHSDKLNQLLSAELKRSSN